MFRTTHNSARAMCLVVLAALAALPACGQADLGVTVLHQFGAFPNDGANPYGSVVFGANGVLYGTAEAGGGPQQNGIVYSLTPPLRAGDSWSQSILWAPEENQGINPYSALVVGPDGALYGTSFGGGNGGNGVIFAVEPPATPASTWKGHVLHWFYGQPDGSSPASGMVLGPGGILYGTTVEGGKANAGAVYSILLPATTGGKPVESVLYSFTGGVDGGNPFGPVILGPGGELYGATRFGGATDYGCVFRLTPPATPGSSWTEQVLYSFSGSPDAYPIAGVIAGAGGVLYGATFGIPQSDHDFGNVYQLSPPAQSGGPWVYTNLHSFTSKQDDAADPVELTLGPGGVLYGTAYAGAGSVFVLEPPVRSGQPWSERLLARTGSSYAPVTIGPDGALYGVSFGKFLSRESAGSVFRMPVR